MARPVALPFTEMTDEGSVWDTGPQYPDMWPDHAAGTPAPDVQDDKQDDKTPETGSPVDFDAPIPERIPEAAAREMPLAPDVALATPTKKEPGQPGWWQRAVLGFPVWILFAFLAVMFVVFILILRSGEPGTTGADRVQTTEVATTVPSQVIPATTAVASTTSVVAPSTAAPTTDSPIFTLPNDAATVVPTTTPTVPATEVATTVPPTTVPVTTVPPTTVPPTTRPVAAPPPATVPPDGPVVTIIGRVGPCDYGSQCLLAGFALHNFNSQPSEFVCEFSDGSRYTFHFTRQEVERACATGDPDGSITIEVDGVRSAPFRRP